MRAPISCCMVCATAHSIEASVKAANENRYRRFAPTRSTSQPLSGSISAMASR